jgi:hypothetical protein
MLRIPHCLDSRLTDGDKVVSPTHPSRFTPHRNIIFMFLVLISVRSKPQELVRPEGLGKFKNHLIGNRTLDLPVFVVLLLLLLCAPLA